MNYFLLSFKKFLILGAIVLAVLIMILISSYMKASDIEGAESKECNIEYSIDDTNLKLVSHCWGKIEASITQQKTQMMFFKDIPEKLTCYKKIHKVGVSYKCSIMDDIVSFKKDT